MFNFNEGKFLPKIVYFNYISNAAIRLNIVK